MEGNYLKISLALYIRLECRRHCNEVVAKSHDLSTIKHSLDLLGRKVRGWNYVNNFMELA